MKIVTGFLMIYFFICCAAVPVDNSETQAVNGETAEYEDFITYLFFEIVKNENGSETVTFEGKQTSKGKLKSVPAFNEDLLNQGDLIVSLMTEDGKLVHRQMIKDPLNRLIESYDGQMHQNEIALDKAEFSLRFPHDKSISRLTVEIFKNSDKHILLEQKLTL